MSDRMEQFESELAGMRPRAVDPKWTQRIAESLDAQRRADRRLIGAMCMGAAAACVIASLLFSQSPRPAASSGTIAVAPQGAHLEKELQLFAGAADVEGWK